MKVTKSIKVHAVDQKRKQALCGQVKFIKPDEMKDAPYLDVTCKLCQGIIENEISSKFGAV